MLRAVARSLPAAALAAVSPVLAQGEAADVRYGRDVRPILADRCFRCHGPDAGSRQAGLRLDRRDDAIAAREGGAAIVPAAPEQSLLWQRVRAHDDDERMPPAASGKAPLNERELLIVERWLRAGAEYEPHWAFVPPRKAPLPRGDADQHPIDRFLAPALAQRGLAPSPPAARAQLARRLFLVLTGLPPTPEELDAFVRDDGPRAYEQLVDALLGDEPYRTRAAEHLAQAWLDAARYADTSGIHMDAGRQAWQWRDWLIAALRDDLPFDRFVIEQLAGDLLPDATPSQQVATGFLRNHVTTDEGGAIDEEYRVEYAAERTATVGSVFFGLTFGCARCHDHKYDPISQQDYYRLFAFFNGNDEPGLYSQSPDANRALEPFLAVPTPEQQQRREALQAELAAAEARLLAPSAEERAAFAALREQLHGGAAGELAAWMPLPVHAASSLFGAEMRVEPDGSVVAGGANPPRDVHVLETTTDAVGLRWLSVEALPGPAAGGPAAGRVGRAKNGNAVLQHVRVRARPRDGSAEWADVPLLYALADVEQESDDFVVTNVLDDDDRGWAVDAHRHAARPARALLLTEAPFGAAGGTELRVTLRYDSVYGQHVFRHVRLSAAAATPAALETLPVAASGFHVAGPFPGGPDDAIYAVAHGPEHAVAVDASHRFGELAWRFDAGLRPGRASDDLPKGRNVTYVAQRLHSPTARRARVSLGSDDGFQLFVNGEQIAERRIDRAVAADQDEATIELPAGPSLLVLKVINTGGNGGFAIRHLPRDDELHGDLRLLTLPAAAAGDAQLLARAETAFREHRSPHHAANVAAAARTKQAAAELDAVIPRAMVMREAKEPRATFVLMRGEYDKPDHERPVLRELPAMFGKLPAQLSRDRLGLAQWLVSADNPLLLRVQANRLWEFVFGTGLVRTSEDFGLQGEWPSHPELLDWLATEFRARGHSVRAMLRLLVTSEAFRQQSRLLPAAAEIDPANRLLAWFPRRRLSAEALRDQALFAGGLLVERAGGPSVKPYQPPDLWQEVAMPQSNTRRYVRGGTSDLWRRSLYTYWKRACPPPSLLALDAPTREFCTIRRITTNTPLQALVLWNDQQFVEAARALAQRTLAEASGDEARLVLMYRRCTSRELGGQALADAMATLHSLRARFCDSPADAEALVAVGEHARPAHVAAGELAPLLVLASAFLNLDATLCID